MTKKTIALCALMSINSAVCINGYLAQPGYQVSEVDPLRARKLEMLGNQSIRILDTQNTLINSSTVTMPRACVGATASSALLAAGGILSEKGEITAAGAFLTVVFFVLSWGTNKAENEKREQLAEEYKETTKAIQEV